MQLILGISHTLSTKVRYSSCRINNNQIDLGVVDTTASKSALHHQRCLNRSHSLLKPLQVPAQTNPVDQPDLSPPKPQWRLVDLPTPPLRAAAVIPQCPIPLPNTSLNSLLRRR
jgi:hypothetical protein